MATPQFDSNTWYSLQSFGTKYYLDCNSISICGAGTDDLTNFERFQVNQPANNTALFLRPLARNTDDSGDPFCINLATGQPFLSLCTNNSATWGTGYWNGQDATDGLFFYNTQRSSNERLSVSQNGVWSFPDYTGLSSADLDQMRWGSSSLADINDQSYSTVPAVITGVTTTAPNTAVVTLSSSTTSETTTTSDPSSRSLSPTATSSPTSAGPESTATTLIVTTPTVTASTTRAGSGSSTMSSTVSPTLQTGGAAGPRVRVLAVLSVVVVAMQGGFLLA